MKRLFDILVSVTALLCFLPFGIIISIILKFTGEGEIFYPQARIGKGGQTFGLLKFATMLKESPNLASGDITLKNDPRVLRFGKHLRITKINEVPQLLNILKGDMSIIGPRPLTARNFDCYPEHVKKEITKVRPGLSGIGSIVFRDEESIIANSNKSYIDCYKEDISTYKGDLELWYIKNNSFFLDIKLILLTIWIVLIPKSDLYKKVLKGLPERRI